MDFHTDCRPFTEILIASGHALAANYFSNLFFSARDGDDRSQYQFASALFNTVVNEDYKKSLQPAFTEAAQDQMMKLGFRIFSETGSRGYGWGAYMTAVCYTDSLGCALNIDEARRWQAIAAASPDALKNNKLFGEWLAKKIDAAEAVARKMGLWPPVPPTLPDASVPGSPTPGAVRPKSRPRSAKKKAAQPVG